MARTEAKLYIVATPLGNREDITLRAIETLRKVNVIFAEDSREITKLFSAHGISTKGKSIHSLSQHNMKRAVEKATNLLEQGRTLVFVSDRGTPAVSDPGALLVHQARNRAVPVVPIPGPSAVTAVLSVYGKNSDQFLFLGFLPARGKQRLELLELMRQVPYPSCFFESPKRIRKTIKELAKTYPNGEIFVGREMTKAFETFQRITLDGVNVEDLIEKGEYTVVLDTGEPEPEQADPLKSEIELRLCSEREWAKKIATRYDLPVSTVYNELQKSKK